MKLNACHVVALAVLGYLVWRAWAPRPIASDDSSLDGSTSDDPFQMFSNALGAGAALGGFDSAAGDLADDSSDDGAIDPNSGDTLGGLL